MLLIIAFLTFHLPCEETRRKVSPKDDYSTADS